MPESDSAASQIAEEKHKGEKQMKVRKKEREKTDRKKRNLRDCSGEQSV